MDEGEVEEMKVGASTRSRAKAPASFLSRQMSSAMTDESDSEEEMTLHDLVTEDMHPREMTDEDLRRRTVRASTKKYLDDPHCYWVLTDEVEEEDDGSPVGALNFKELFTQLSPVVCSRAFRSAAVLGALAVCGSLCYPSYQAFREQPGFPLPCYHVRQTFGAGNILEPHGIKLSMTFPGTHRDPMKAMHISAYHELCSNW